MDSTRFFINPRLFGQQQTKETLWKQVINFYLRSKTQHFSVKQGPVQCNWLFFLILRMLSFDCLTTLTTLCPMFQWGTNSDIYLRKRKKSTIEGVLSHYGISLYSKIRSPPCFAVLQFLIRAWYYLIIFID